MSERHYRLARKPVEAGRAVVEGYEALVSCGDKPAKPRVPIAMYNCHNPACDSREQIVMTVYLFGATQERLRQAYCVYCREPMRFESYLEKVQLAPVNEGEDADDEFWELIRPRKADKTTPE